MDRSPKQLQDLTLALLYLTSRTMTTPPAAGAGRDMTFRFWRT